MNKTDVRAVILMAIVCFTVSILASNYQMYLDPHPRSPLLAAMLDWLNTNTRLAGTLKLVASTSLFIGLFKIFLKMYESSALWQIFHIKDNLNGPWVYIFNDAVLKARIYGTFEVVHNMKGIVVVNGHCWYEGETQPTESNQRGTWFSRQLAVSGENYWLPYEMEILNSRPDHKENSYAGVMKIQQFDEEAMRTKTWHGTISHHNAPIAHSGQVWAKRLLSRDRNKMKSWDHLPTLIKHYFDVDVSAQNGRTIKPHTVGLDIDT